MASQGTQIKDKWQIMASRTQSDLAPISLLALARPPTCPPSLNVNFFLVF